LIRYVLTKKRYLRLRHIKSKLVCKKCLKELKIGDCIKSNRNSGTAKLYHCDCYDKLFIDLSDWETIIGIEVKFNRRLPAARNEKSNILEDVKKVKDLVKTYSNVHLFYLALLSDPIKTNVQNFLK